MRLVIMVVLSAALALPVGAVSKAKRCRQVCVALIATCTKSTAAAGFGNLARGCKQAVLKRCGREGPAVCVAGTETPSTTTPSTTTTTTSGTTTTTLRFVDNRDGTVTDHRTGLQWEQKDYQFPGNHNVEDRYRWSAAAGDAFRTGSAFTEFLALLDDSESLNGMAEGSRCFAGHCDWRMPTIVELDGIVDMGAPGCNTGFRACIHPIFGATLPDKYWSATSDSQYAPAAWSLDFQSGVAVKSLLKNSVARVRAVRGGS